MTEWEMLLTEASQQVQRVADSCLPASVRARVVGTGASGDITLVADRDAEREVVKVLSSAVALRILSEEAGELGEGGSRYVAVVDPLDGSSNFSRGIPFYCTSICVVEGRSLRDAKYALVRNLVNGDVYYAERGRGARKNGDTIRPSSAKELSDSVLAIDFSKATLETVRGLSPLISKVRRQVHFGANALELCFVAEGVVDAFVDLRNRMRVTDLAGAYLIATEAGAAVTSETGGELDTLLDLGQRVNCVAAANSSLQGKLIAETATLRRGTP